ncbi:hypothetical protein EV356DRAFT_503152 [Viridothelium virens]|uniref:Uncharacterized protein n=1 Tax=Viridothelium virens TaxID=1048519 RepID=A0A6A6H7Q3_VIRVR|nr:hypothetical protein EV356DRAFT_503152 [Viridothelium virens]
MAGGCGNSSCTCSSCSCASGSCSCGVSALRRSLHLLVTDLDSEINHVLLVNTDVPS